jgi:hypothetical protein
MWQKRKIIQSNRQISILHFFKLLDWNPLAPLLKLRH